jgi:hypothetical protein
MLPTLAGISPSPKLGFHRLDAPAAVKNPINLGYNCYIAFLCVHVEKGFAGMEFHPAIFHPAARSAPDLKFTS